MAQLCEQLPVLERGPSGREIRVAVELLMDTGRRPAEILRLRFDCLIRDPDNAAVLIYDNHEQDRRERRLPISQATAAVITAQQQRIRERFPDTPLAELVLLEILRRAGLIETERITGWNYHRRSEAGLRHARRLLGEV